MVPKEDENIGILSEIQRFFKQQQEQYGDALYAVMPERAVRDEPKEPVMAQQQSQPEISMKSKTLFQPEQIAEAKNASPSLPSYPKEPWTKAQTVESLREQICTCTKCSLGKTRNKFVFGVGNVHAEIVVIGEAPGADEDAQGEPFVGRAGQLLTKILEAIKFKREDIFICNMLKCRPPNNRDPLPEEVTLCEPYLWKQLELIKPKMILCVGRIAGQSVLKVKEPLGALRGKMHDYRGIPLVVTFHPAALLRNPNWKRPCWEDVQQFRAWFDEIKAKETGV